MDHAAQLEAEYCPPIDPSLLFAIVSDFDLARSSDYDAAKATLEQLKESALIEEATDFEPSGVGSNEVSPAHDGSSSAARSAQNGDEYRSMVTDETSVSNELSAPSLSSNSSAAEHGASLDSYDEDTKMLLLIDVFGEQVGEHTIRSALHNSDGNWTAAMEELLNQVYFHDAEHSDSGAHHVLKGIDGFSEERVTRRPKRQRNRAKRISSSVESSADESSYPLSNRWQRAHDDVDFIVSRTRLDAGAVRIVYNQHGASLPQTINALLKDEMKSHKKKDDENTIQLAKELSDDFPTIDMQYLLSLIRITHPSIANAHELARALVAQPTSSSGQCIIPQYKRLTDRDLDAGPSSSANTQSLVLSSLAPESYALARAQAFAQASAAHRRARSDRLMGGAAAYYGQLGRDYSTLTHAANASAANALADSQSSAGQVDLHGVDVLNAVRIAREKTEQWWRTLGEDRANGRLGAAHRGQGFRIVVGRGTHSEGGKGKLGPAVMKMLRSEGWRFNNEGAAIAVTGKLKS